MALIALALLGVLAVKMIATFNAIRWMHGHGQSYRRLVLARPPAGPADRELLAELSGGAFFPFGVKDYRLRRYLRTAEGGHLRRLARPLLVAFYLALFRLGWLLPVCAFFNVALASSPDRLALLPWWLGDPIGSVLGLSLLAATILIIVEAVYGYAVLGSYGLAFHLLDPRQAEPERHLLRELQIFVGTVMVALLSAVSAVYFTSVRLGGYEKLTGDVTTPSEVLARISDSAYYTFMAFLGSGEADPQGFVAKLVTGLIGLQGFCFLVLVLGVLASATPLPALSRPRHGPSAEVAAVLGEGHGATAGSPLNRNARPAKSRVSGFVLGALTTMAVTAILRYLRRRKARGERTGG